MQQPSMFSGKGCAWHQMCFKKAKIYFVWLKKSDALYWLKGTGRCRDKKRKKLILNKKLLSEKNGQVYESTRQYCH